jgi:hypothetical protein
MGDQVRPAIQMIDDVQRELTAMRALADALRGLDAPVRLRVLRWALAREEAREAGVAPAAWPATRDTTVPGDGLGIEDLSDLFEPDANAPASGVALKRA